MRSTLLVCQIILALLFCLSLSPVAAAVAEAAPQPPPISIVPGTVPADQEVAAAAIDALNTDRAGLPEMQYAAITSVAAVPGWQLVSVAGLRNLQPDGSWQLAENASWFGLVIATQAAGGGWTAAVEHTPEFTALVTAAPETLLSSRAKADLAPQNPPALPRSQSLQFPWIPGTAMLFGARGVHNSDFDVAFGISGWRAVDMLSDGDTSQGHASNLVLAAGAGTIGAVCNDQTSVAIRMDLAGSPQLLYVHLLDNARLRSGQVFSQGDELGQLKSGSFSAGCGWAQQAPEWFHVHWAFPGAGGSFDAGGWTLTFADATWRSRGQQVEIGDWLGAGPPPAPALIEPPAGGVEPATYPLKFTWNAAPGASEYQIAWWGGPYTNTQPLGWFAGTSYDVGLVATGTYTWRVRARNTTGPGPWSETRQITLTPVEITAALTVTPTTQEPNALITARFAIANTTEQTLTLAALAARARDSTCADWSCQQIVNFSAETGVVLAPRQVYEYQGERAFAVGGPYVAAPAYQDAAGAWHYALPGANQVSFRIALPLSTYLPLLLTAGDIRSNTEAKSSDALAGYISEEQ
jgi:hypothetical protein